MKTYKEEQVTRIEQRIISKICDKCNKEIKLDWYDAFSTRIEVRKGTQFPEGGSGDRWEIEDICESCSEDLKELLTTNGYRIKEEEWDY